MLSFVAAKDVFAAFYKNDLAKRLLLNRWYSAFSEFRSLKIHAQRFIRARDENRFFD
jgi:hypothetical protein